MIEIQLHYNANYRPETGSKAVSEENLFPHSAPIRLPFSLPFGLPFGVPFRVPFRTPFRDPFAPPSELPFGSARRVHVLRERLPSVLISDPIQERVSNPIRAPSVLEKRYREVSHIEKKQILRDSEKPKAGASVNLNKSSHPDGREME